MLPITYRMVMGNISRHVNHTSIIINKNLLCLKQESLFSVTHPKQNDYG